MKFHLPAIALFAAVSQFSVAEKPNTRELAIEDLPGYAAAQHDTNGASAAAEETPNVDSGNLPGAIIQVASSLERKLEQRLQASFDLGFTVSGDIASAH